jgi:hypothetical protein
MLWKESGVWIHEDGYHCGERLAYVALRSVGDRYHVGALGETCIGPSRDIEGGNAWPFTRLRIGYTFIEIGRGVGTLGADDY